VSTDIDSFIEQQIAAGLNPTTINRRLSSIHTFFEYLASEKPEQNWPNPVVSRRHYLKTGSHLPRDVSDDDVARLCAVIDDERDRAMFGLMVGAGLRLSELLDLRLGDLDLTAGYATVRGSEPGRDRVIYLTPALNQVLKHYLAQRPDLPDEDHLFVLQVHGRSPTPRTIQRRPASYGQLADVEVSPHKLRHTIATRLINQGMPIHSLRKMLGHENLNTTQLYARIYDETLHAQFKEAMSRLEAIEVENWPGAEINGPALMEIETPDIQ
jgi:integrase/recombinase XerD